MDVMLIATMLVYGLFVLAAVTLGADSRDMLDDPGEWTSHVGLS